LVAIGIYIVRSRIIDMTMTQSFSSTLPVDDLKFLDDYGANHKLPSRAAVLREAVRALRNTELEQAYLEEFEEWGASGEAAAWDSTAGDGIGDQP
jgi:Arc/MetJ-type ribon-helix-helix transcriptional regulator